MKITIEWQCKSCQRMKPDIFTNGCTICTVSPLIPLIDGKEVTFEEVQVAGGFVKGPNYFQRLYNRFKYRNK